jgi:hypothetical protein
MSVYVICGRDTGAPQYGPFEDGAAAVAWLDDAHCVFIQTSFPVNGNHYRMCSASRPKRLHRIWTLPQMTPPEAGDGRLMPSPTWGRHATTRPRH